MIPPKRTISDSEKKRRISQLVEQMRKEVSNFKKRKRLAYLMQASEKAWMIYWLLVETYLHVEVTGKTKWHYADIARRKDPTFDRLKYVSMGLHEFHYQGMSEPEIIVAAINHARKLITKIRQRHNLY